MLILDGLAKMYVLELDETIHGGRYYFNRASVIDFSTSINPLGASPHVIKAIMDSLSSISEYPDPYARRLRSSIADYVGVEDECILACNGSSEAIYAIADALVKEGDSIAVLEPTFLEYAYACKKNGAVIKHIMMHNLSLDCNDILDSIEGRDGAKIIFICNPNNPTGLLASDNAILKIIEHCYNRGIIVVLDECFIEFTDMQGYARRVKEFDNLIVIRSLTKAFGLAGLRVGYCISDPRIVRVLSKVKVPWSVNILAQIAGVEALKDMAHLERSKKIIMEEKRFLIDNLSSMQWLEPLESDTNFFLIRLKNIGSKELRDRLLAKNILVRDCSNFYGMNNSYIRVSTRLREDNLALIDAIKGMKGYEVHNDTGHIL